MSTDNTSIIEAFVHEQIACWNRGDKEGFFAAYRSVATEKLLIEYVGKPEADGWPILEGMWAQSQEKIEVEEVLIITAGDEVACHNRNNIRGTEQGIETIELYKLSAGCLTVRYFIKMP